MPKINTSRAEANKLRDRAMGLGYHLRRRGIKYSLIPLKGGGREWGIGSIADVPKQLDIIEGKVAVQFYTPCGTLIEGMNNAEAVAEYKNKNAIPAEGDTATPEMTYEIHPLADIFPEMTEAELNDLGEDIAKHGQRESITLFEGKILDGRNRYKACLLKGVEPRISDFLLGDDADPVQFVISKNLHRRHLNESQRAMVAAKLANLPHGGDRSKSPNGGLPQAEAAKLMNVSKRSVERAREVTKHGDRELTKAVTQGEVKVSAAAKFAKKVLESGQAIDAGSVRAMTDILREQRLTEKAKAKEERESAAKKMEEADPGGKVRTAIEKFEAKQKAERANRARLPPGQEARIEYYSATPRTRRLLAKVRAAMEVVQAAIPDPLEEVLAPYVAAIALIEAKIVAITDATHHYEPCELAGMINKAAEADKEFEAALIRTGFGGAKADRAETKASS